jgi:hypothetical protein
MVKIIRKVSFFALIGTGVFSVYHNFVTHPYWHTTLADRWSDPINIVLFAVMLFLYILSGRL